MGGLFFLCKIPVLVTLLDKIKRFLKGFSGHFVVIFVIFPLWGWEGLLKSCVFFLFVWYGFL